MKNHWMLLAITSTALLAISGNSQATGNFGIGLGVFSGSNEYKDIDTKNYVLPVITYESENFTLSPTRGEYHFQFTSNMWISMIGSARLQGYKAKDSAAFKGMDDRKNGFDLGASINVYDQEIGLLSLEWLTDVTGKSKGDEVTAAWSYPFEGKSLAITPSVYWRWQSADLVNYYYGVKEKEVTSNRSVYSPTSNSNVGAAISINYPLSESTGLFSGVSVYSLGNKIKKSPLVDDGKDLGYSASIGLIYKF